MRASLLLLVLAGVALLIGFGCFERLMLGLISRSLLSIRLLVKILAHLLGIAAWR